MNRECLEKSVGRVMCVGSQTAVSVIRGWSDIGVLTRAVKTISHVTEDPGETKILKTLPRVDKVF